MTGISFWLNDNETELIIKKYQLSSDEKLGLQLKKAILIEKIEDPIKEKIQYQMYLKLCLQNWRLLKESGSIFEEAKAIIQGKKELEEPRIDFHKLEGILCTFCHHAHASTDPKVCTNLNCNCGVRG